MPFGQPGWLFPSAVFLQCPVPTVGTQDGFIIPGPCYNTNTPRALKARIWLKCQMGTRWPKWYIPQEPVSSGWGFLTGITQIMNFQIGKVRRLSGHQENDGMILQKKWRDELTFNRSCQRHKTAQSQLGRDHTWRCPCTASLLSYLYLCFPFFLCPTF